MKYKGKLLQEITKGSLDYRRMQILMAFRAAFPEPEGTPWYYSVEETFDDYLVVRLYGSRMSIPNPLMPDEFYRVDFTEANGIFAFSKQPWSVIELTYQPQGTGTPAMPAAVAVEDAPSLMESAGKKGKRLVERLGARIALEEASSDGAMRRIRANNVVTADVINENGRRYSGRVLSAAIEGIRKHLHESAGQGHAIQVLGEAEHPSDKASKRANLLETVVKWDEVSFDKGVVSLGGTILGTAKGKDLQALMEGGVLPGVSLRGYGETKEIKENGQRIEEVLMLQLTGFDLVLEPSFESAQAILESIQFKSSSSEEEMDILEELKKARIDHPELFMGITESQLAEMSASQLQKIEGDLRKALNIGLNESIIDNLTAARQAQVELAEIKRKASVETVITEATKDLKYGDVGNKSFVAAIIAANPQDAQAVKTLVEAKRAEYDALYAQRQLQGMGFGRVTGVAPVLERETGTPEFARAAHELAESVRRVNMTIARDWNNVVTRNDLFTKQVLQRFDVLYGRELLNESRQLTEAQDTSVMNLPYSVSRLIIEEAFPNLVASGIFDVGIMNTSPERLYFETFTGETGYSATSTAEVTAADLNAWVKLDYGRITPASFVLTNSAANVTYVENADYIVDYAAGRYKALATITDAQSLKATYDYTAMRDGEMAPIQRGKITLSYKTIEAAADRLADRISREAIVFSQSQLGYDVVARVLANLVRQQNRKIDQGLLMMAWSQVHAVSGNEAGVWTPGTAQTDYAELVRLMGLAKIKVSGRYYKPDYFLCSEQNAEILSNWEGFQRTGFPNAVLSATGFAGGVKGLPIFTSTEFPSDIILCGNSQLVMYRVYQPLSIKGPYPTTNSSGDLIAADQYYTEQFNATESPIAEKGSYVTIGEEAS